MKVLFATNGSRESDAAGEWLTGLCWAEDDRVTVLSVVPDLLFLSGRIDVEAEGSCRERAYEEIIAAGEIVRQAMRKLDMSFPRVETRVHAGPPAEEILTVAEEIGADLIVIGSRGKSAVAEWFLGSVSEELLKKAPCPVLIVRPGSESVGRILLAYDGSPESEAALGWVTRLPVPPGARIKVVGVAEALSPAMAAPSPALPPEYYSTMAAVEGERRERARWLTHHAAKRLKASGRRAEAEIRYGDAATEIELAAKEGCADLVLLGAHARHGWISDLLGNTARAIVRHACCSVLVARTSGDRIEEKRLSEEGALEGADEKVFPETPFEGREGTDESPAFDPSLAEGSAV